MKITGLESETAVLKELGERIKSQRISLQYSQVQLANKCGMSEGSIKRIESGKGFHISQLIKIMSALGIASNLDALIPAEVADYKAMFDKTPKRKRVKRSRKTEAPAWKWGDETE